MKPNDATAIYEIVMSKMQALESESNRAKSGRVPTNWIWASCSNGWLGPRLQGIRTIRLWRKLSDRTKRSDATLAFQTGGSADASQEA